MSMGPGKFDNIFARLNVELDRLQRAGVPTSLIANFKVELLKHRPESEVPIALHTAGTTPYQIAFNRLSGFQRGEYTWDYFLKAWDECSTADQEALNQLIEAPLDTHESEGE